MQEEVLEVKEKEDEEAERGRMSPKCGCLASKRRCGRAPSPSPGRLRGLGFPNRRSVCLACQVASTRGPRKEVERCCHVCIRAFEEAKRWNYNVVDCGG